MTAPSPETDIDPETDVAGEGLAGRFRAALRRGPVLLDAAHGTRLIVQGLDPARDDPALWNLDRPEEVARLHALDVAAGADALLTNTFGANRTWLARFGRADAAVAANRRGVELARDAAGPDRLVIGSIGPTGGHAEQAKALVAAGADALLLETHDPASAAAGLGRLGRLREATGVPVLVSLFAWPDEPSETARTLAGLGASALGVNCVAGPDAALAVARKLRAATDLPLLAKPNAGPPGAPAIEPGAFAAALPALLGLGVWLVGGCCGTTDAHLAALRAALGPPPARTQTRPRPELAAPPPGVSPTCP